MLKELNGLLAPYVASLAGVAIGALAHFGRIITDHGWPSPREIVGFVLQLGLIVVVAVYITEQLHIVTGSGKTITASVLTITTNEVYRWAREKGAALLGQRPPTDE